MTMHKKKSNTFDRFPLLSWLWLSFLRIPHFYGMPFSFLFNLLFSSLSLSYEGRMEFREPIVGSGLLLGGAWLIDLGRQIVIQMTMHMFTLHSYQLRFVARM
jgi:hypothetical protein